MGHWKRLIKIPSATDCYYCIKNMTCLIYVSYCVDILVTVPDYLFAIMSPVYHVTFSDIRYIPCGSMRFILCIAYGLFLVFLADIMTIYARHHMRVTLHTLTCMFILHMSTCMFISIHFYHVTTRKH